MRHRIHRLSSLIAIAAILPLAMVRGYSKSPLAGAAAVLAFFVGSRSPRLLQPVRRSQVCGGAAGEGPRSRIVSIGEFHPVNHVADEKGSTCRWRSPKPFAWCSALENR